MIELHYKLTGTTTIGFSKAVQSPKNTGEAHDAYELRTWREKMHTTPDGEVFIPPNAIKNMLGDVAKYLSESVPGKGKATFTKHFEAGCLVTDPVLLGIKSDQVEPMRVFVPSDGKRGGGKRVWKHFPVIHKWSGVAKVIVLDPILIDKPEKVTEYMEQAGRFIGLGWFRPRNNGYFGRFDVEHINAK